MSTFTAIGPALNLDGPLPRAPLYTLLSVPGVVQGANNRVFNGVNVWGYPEETPSTWEPCSDGTFRVKDETSTQSMPRFDAFTIYQPLTCSSISLRPEDRERAERVLDATQSFAVEFGLSQGVVGSTNPFLSDPNAVALGGGAVAPDVALALLEEAIGATGRGGLIHAPPDVASQWTFDGGLDSSGGTLRTWLGTPVAVGGGYIGANGQTTDAYAFATGPVEVYLSPMRNTEPRESLDRADNVFTFLAERDVLALWDTALQVEVLVDYTP